MIRANIGIREIVRRSSSRRMSLAAAMEIARVVSGRLLIAGVTNRPARITGRLFAVQHRSRRALTAPSLPRHPSS
jgi:hypothetical protein